MGQAFSNCIEDDGNNFRKMHSIVYASKFSTDDEEDMLELSSHFQGGQVWLPDQDTMKKSSLHLQNARVPMNNFKSLNDSTSNIIDDIEDHRMIELIDKEERTDNFNAPIASLGPYSLFGKEKVDDVKDQIKSVRDKSQVEPVKEVCCISAAGQISPDSTLVSRAKLPMHSIPTVCAFDADDEVVLESSSHLQDGHKTSTKTINRPVIISLSKLDDSKEIFEMADESNVSSMITKPIDGEAETDACNAASPDVGYLDIDEKEEENGLILGNDTQSGNDICLKLHSTETASTVDTDDDEMRVKEDYNLTQKVENNSYGVISIEGLSDSRKTFIDESGDNIMTTIIRDEGSTDACNAFIPDMDYVQIEEMKDDNVNDDNTSLQHRNQIESVEFACCNIDREQMLQHSSEDSRKKSSKLHSLDNLSTFDAGGGVYNNITKDQILPSNFEDRRGSSPKLEFIQTSSAFDNMNKLSYNSTNGHKLSKHFENSRVKSSALFSIGTKSTFDANDEEEEDSFETSLYLQDLGSPLENVKDNYRSAQYRNHTELDEKVSCISIMDQKFANCIEYGGGKSPKLRPMQDNHEDRYHIKLEEKFCSNRFIEQKYTNRIEYGGGKSPKLRPIQTMRKFSADYDEYHLDTESNAKDDLRSSVLNKIQFFEKKIFHGGSICVVKPTETIFGSYLADDCRKSPKLHMSPVDIDVRQNLPLTSFLLHDNHDPLRKTGDDSGFIAHPRLDHSRSTCDHIDESEGFNMPDSSMVHLIIKQKEEVTIEHDNITVRDRIEGLEKMIEKEEKQTEMLWR